MFNGGSQFTVYRSGEQKRRLCEELAGVWFSCPCNYTTLWKLCNIKTVSEYMDSLSLFRTISNHLHFNLPVLVYETHETYQCLSMKRMDLWTYLGNRLFTTPVFLSATDFSSSIQMSLYFCQIIWWYVKNWSKHLRIYSPVMYVSEALWSNKST